MQQKSINITGKENVESDGGYSMILPKVLAYHYSGCILFWSYFCMSKRILPGGTAYFKRWKNRVWVQTFWQLVKMFQKQISNTVTGDKLKHALTIWNKYKSLGTRYDKVNTGNAKGTISTKRSLLHNIMWFYSRKKSGVEITMCTYLFCWSFFLLL